VRIAFVHRTVVDYTVETPYRRAIGGTESALVYVATALAARGHLVSLLTNASDPGLYRGVQCLNYKTALTPQFIAGCDVVVVSNEAVGRVLRDDFKAVRPLVLWCQHADDQPAIDGLEFTRERKAWAGFAFVSQWQMDAFCRVFWVPPERSRVMRNAVSPAFAALALQEPWFRSAAPPVLAYTSAPYRGLDVLLAAFPAIRGAVAGARLKVFSGLSTTRGGPDDNEYADLHRQCLATEGVDYVGPVAQPVLAAELAQAAALAYPSTYPETSCIAVMEAMAAGATILTTRLGALPETMAGFGYMTLPSDEPAKLTRDFAVMAIGALNAMRADPDTAWARREAQLAHIARHCQWTGRAAEWESWLGEIVARHAN
jgi:glycosyltransferase involved in cell wall biosynthesis